MQPLSLSFYGSQQPKLLVEADLSLEHFGEQGDRIAFDHRVDMKLQAGERLYCHLRLSTAVSASSYLFERLRQADFEMNGNGFDLLVTNARLSLRVDRQRTNWALTIEEKGLDFTQAIHVDRTVAPLQMLRGVPTLFPKAPIHEPRIPCYLHIKIDVRDPLRMEVADRIEPVENRAVVSTGRPESNRSRF